jgi:hypothetical protein
LSQAVARELGILLDGSIPQSQKLPKIPKTTFTLRLVLMKTLPSLQAQSRLQTKLTLQTVKMKTLPIPQLLIPQLLLLDLSRPLESPDTFSRAQFPRLHSMTLPFLHMTKPYLADKPLSMPSTTPKDIPINRRTLERVALYAYHMRVANTDLINKKSTSVYAKVYNSLGLHPGFAELKKTLVSIADLMYGFEKEAMRRDNILFKHNTTSATQEQAISWIADVTRNPENSVRSHALRFTAWVDLVEAEVDSAIYTDGASLPGGALPLARRAINLVFEQEEVRNRMAQQGEYWAGSPDAWVTPTELDEECIRYVRRRDREFPPIYVVDDRDDLDHPLYPSMPRIVSSTGRYVQIPNVVGVSDPSVSNGDMMDVD